MARRRQWWQSDPEISDSQLQELAEIGQLLKSAADLGPLIDRIGNASFVLLGEASHGTAEYYDWRTRITQRLLEEKGFSFVAVEGDWPDCYRINEYVKGSEKLGESARDVLHGFHRWPTWMWANEEIVALSEWMREFNKRQTAERKAGFYGLDVYSLWDSLYAVIQHLKKNAPDALAAARKAFRCFEPYGEDVQEYASATRWIDATCEEEVVKLLAEVRRSNPPPSGGAEEQFNAEQNALIVKNAEHYYRTMVRGGADSWNARDRHMTETLERLMSFHGRQAKAIVWEHNTHVGDARHTDMVDDGMVNVGQLVREKQSPDDVVLVGFGSYAGRVIAGVEWEAPMERMPVPPARTNSWEEVLHRASPHDKLIIFDQEHRSGWMSEMRGHRAIGVVYDPQREAGNYVPTVLPSRYDALIYLDQTHALHPLTDLWVEKGMEVPETFPTGV